MTHLADGFVGVPVGCATPGTTFEVIPKRGLGPAWNMAGRR